MIVYGSSMSPFVRKVLAFAAEKGIAVESKPVGLGSEDVDTHRGFLRTAGFWLLLSRVWAAACTELSHAAGSTGRTSGSSPVVRTALGSSSASAWFATTFAARSKISAEFR